MSTTQGTPGLHAGLYVTLDCGHEHRSVEGVQVGDEHPCWSACDGVPTMQTPRIRRVAAVHDER